LPDEGIRRLPGNQIDCGKIARKQESGVESAS
jgi:hypothetical protein